MKPNILLIFADQMRGDTMGCAGHPVVQTPHLDRLAATGVQFDRAYTPNPICVPARASLTTGNYPHKCTGTKDNSGRIRDDQVKMAEFFARSGYGTYASGKLHYVPYSPPGMPRLVHGFDQVLLHESGRIVHQFDPAGTREGLEDYHDFLKAVGWGGYERAHGIGNNDIHPAPSPLPPELYVDSWTCTKGIDLLESHSARYPRKPFFMFLSFPKPHAPYDPPRPYDALYDPRAVPPPVQALEDPPRRTPTVLLERITHGWNLWSPEMHRLARAYYYGVVTFQDLQIGRMLQYLQTHGLLDDTIVIYTADHGDLIGDFGFFAKGCFYEGSVRVPLIISWPRVLRQGVRSDALVGLQDVLPTLASLTGLKLPQNVDGIDLAPLLKGKSFEPRPFYVSYCLDPPRQLYMIADTRYKYIYSQVSGIDELYDLQEDPHESRNLVGKASAARVLRAMRHHLVHWAEENEDRTILDGRDLKVTHEDILRNAGFQDRTMGWRWY